MAGPTSALREGLGPRWALSDHGGPNISVAGGVGPRVVVLAHGGKEVRVPRGAWTFECPRGRLGIW